MTSFRFCSMVASSTLNLLTNISNTIFLHHPPASGDPVVCYSLVPCELSSAVGFHHPWHQGKGVITQQEIVQIWSSLPSGSVGRSPKVPSSIFFLNLLQLKICVSDEDPFDPKFTQRNLYSVSTNASSTREKKPL